MILQVVFVGQVPGSLDSGSLLLVAWQARCRPLPHAAAEGLSARTGCRPTLEVVHGSGCNVPRDFLWAPGMGPYLL